MSSYVPKTAWRLTDINKRYGIHALGLQTSKDWAVPPNFNTATPTQFATKKTASAELKAKQAIAERVRASKMIIDIRPPSEMRRYAIYRNRQTLDLGKARVAPLAFEDLLSGAADGLLPKNKKEPIIVVASDSSTSRNGFNALRRAGYFNVTIMDDKVLFKATRRIDDLKKKSDLASAKEATPAPEESKA